MKDIGRQFVLVAAMLMLASGVAMAQQTGLPLQEGVPLHASIFATDLNFPVGMVVLPDGSLLVGSSNPTGGTYFSSTGELVRLMDADGDGVADGPVETVATGLAGMVTAVAVHGDLVAVTSVESGRERIQLLRATEDWTGTYVLLGEMTFAFDTFAHQSYGLAMRESPGNEQIVELHFNVGASGNETDGRYVTVGGLLDTQLIDASLYMTEITDHGATLAASEPVRIASGLRNAMAFAFHPESGDLWITDNGIDGFVDVWVSYSADELNVIPAATIGGDIEHFGFPVTYTLYETGEVVGQHGLPPVVEFVPIGVAENEGVSSLAFTPPTFAGTLGEGVLVGFHGQYDMWGVDNEENALLFVDLTSLDVSIVVAPGMPGVGHLNSIATGDGAMYVADMCVGQSLASAGPCGIIYRLTTP